MAGSSEIENLEKQLNDFNPETRRNALEKLAEALKAGKIKAEAPSKWHNLHSHTFFSYNAYGYSPSGVMWEAKKRGLCMMGTVDFDVLDGMDEAYAAADLLGMPATVGLETRVYVKDYSDRELNSPGEPGIFYYISLGYTRAPAAGSAGFATLSSMSERAGGRNRAMIDTINKFLGKVAVDYDKEVLPLTPAGNATERHMLQAYDEKSRKVLGEGDALVAFWAEKLGMDAAATKSLLGDSPKFRNTMRAKLMKKGGVAYAAPKPDNFPSLEEAVAMTRSVEALPVIAWLDGTTPGEADAEKFLAYFLSKDVPLLSIIPDRNWNISDPKSKEIKVNKLNEIIALCRQRNVPVVVGTEMNSFGNKFVDTFDAPEMLPHMADFTAGADFTYGHTLMQRALGHGLLSSWAQANFRDAASANKFFISIGQAAGKPAAAISKLKKLPNDHTPAQAQACLK